VGHAWRICAGHDGAVTCALERSAPYGTRVGDVRSQSCGALLCFIGYTTARVLNFLPPIVLGSLSLSLANTRLAFR